jgi:hypothetical protein
MRLWTIPILVALLLSAACGVGFAIPSLNGPTGIVTVPNAYVVPLKSIDYALSYQKFKVMNLVEAADMYGGSALSETPNDMTAWSLQALAGVADKAELWAAYQSIQDHDNSSIWGIGGKVQLAKEPEDSTSLAVGAGYRNWIDAFTTEITTTTGLGTPIVIASTTDNAKIWNAYIVASKDFTPMKSEKWEWGPGGGTRMIGSLGLVYLNADVPGTSESLTRPFLGAEFVGAAGTTLGLEYRWKDNDLDEKAVFSAVVRHQFSPEVTAELGTTNANPVGLGLDDQNWFVRLGYHTTMGK